MSNADLFLRICLQLAVILFICRLCGIVGRRLGQTQVVCDMIAGILLGPSCFGLLFPVAQQWLFPRSAEIVGQGGTVTITHPAMSILYVFAQVGIALYMFLVGLEFDFSMLGSQRRNAAIISGTSILAPLLLGLIASIFIFRVPGLFGQGVTPLLGSLFLALSLSITAFPVLARILQEHGMATTRVGTLAISAAAIGDATAWCLLAFLLALAQGSPQGIIVTLCGTALFVLVMLTLGRLSFRRFAGWVEQDEGISTQNLVVVLIIVLLSAWFTTYIGIHQIFGAFIAGVAMPRGRFATAARAQLEPLTISVFLPLFLIYTGLNTSIGLLNSPFLWLLTLLIIGLAILGKGVGCMLAARALGQSWRLAGTIGALMNARGLIELILLTVGLERHIISPTLFTMLVLMAIVTTLLTTPLFRMFHPLSKVPAPIETPATIKSA